VAVLSAAAVEAGMVEYLLGGLIVVFMVLLAIGALTGRVKARSCCSIPDPSRDRMMTDAEPADPRPLR
jgi:hypothetical protein